MAEKVQLKDWFDRARYAQFAEQISSISTQFDRNCFLAYTCDGLESRELLARVRRTSEAIKLSLPGAYPEQLEIVRQLAPKIGHTFIGIVPADFVGLYGRAPEHFELSLRALAELTRYGSAEFAIREFLRIDFKSTIEFMHEWSRSTDEHVRRLASEGCRPRLPWSFHLETLIRDPEPVLPILENLRADPSLYVRKSVANHLNDIGKDHPDRMLDILHRWDLSHPHTAWIAKRAARTLIKKGNPTALALFGFGSKPKLEVLDWKLSPKRLKIGDRLAINCKLRSTAKKTQSLAIDLVIHYRKQRGQLGPKVFKWTECILKPNEILSLQKSQRFCDFSTRIHHPGTHKVELQINGHILALANFMLYQNLS